MIMNIRIGPCDHKAVWFVVLVLKTAALALVLASVFLPVWATTDDNELGLFKCYSDCAKDNYKDQRALTCSQADLAEDFNNQDMIYMLRSGCKMFTGLEKAFYSYAICAGGAVFATLVWFVSIFTFCSRKITLACGAVFGFISFACQAAGVVLWIFQSNTGLSGCEGFPDDGGKPKLCVDVGIKIAMAAGAVYLVSLLVYVVVGSKVKQRIIFMETRKVKTNAAVQPDNSTLPIRPWNKSEL